MWNFLFLKEKAMKHFTIVVLVLLAHQIYSQDDSISLDCSVPEAPNFLSIGDSIPSVSMTTIEGDTLDINKLIKTTKLQFYFCALFGVLPA